jgi:hypothetical protein
MSYDYFRQAMDSIAAALRAADKAGVERERERIETEILAMISREEQPAGGNARLARALRALLVRVKDGAR